MPVDASLLLEQRNSVAGVFKRIWATLETTFGGTMLFGAAIEWDNPNTPRGLAFGLLSAQPVLAAAGYLLAKEAPHLQGAPFWKVCARVWVYTIPIGYILLMLVSMLESGDSLMAFFGFVLFAPFVIPVVSLCFAPAVGVTAWLTRRWAGHSVGSLLDDEVQGGPPLDGGTA